MAARTTQDMLHATGAMANSAASYARGNRDSVEQRQAHAYYARYAESTAVNDPEHTTYRRERARRPPHHACRRARRASARSEQ